MTVFEQLLCILGAITLTYICLLVIIKLIIFFEGIRLGVKRTLNRLDDHAEKIDKLLLERYLFVKNENFAARVRTISHQVAQETIPDMLRGVDWARIDWNKLLKRGHRK